MPTYQVLVDDQDRDLLSYTWRSNHNGYPVAHRRTNRTPSGHEMIRLHRVIMERMVGRRLTPKELVDHINHDKLDNRRANLRISDASQNLFNMRSIGGSSRFKGVCWDKSRGKWKSEIRTYSTKVYVGRFDDEVEAAWMHDQYALALHDDFAYLNFDYI